MVRRSGSNLGVDQLPQLRHYAIADPHISTAIWLTQLRWVAVIGQLTVIGNSAVADPRELDGNYQYRDVVLGKASDTLRYIAYRQSQPNIGCSLAQSFVQR